MRVKIFFLTICRTLLMGLYLSHFINGYNNIFLYNIICYINSGVIIIIIEFVYIILKTD